MKVEKFAFLVRYKLSYEASEGYEMASQGI
jgi:hypothetical protein